MTTEQASKIGAPEFLQGRSESIPTTRFAIAIPQDIAANISRHTGSLLTSAPGKVTVSTLSGLGWATFGTVHRIMWASRLMFTGAKTEQAVHQVAESVDFIGQRELEAKETLKNSVLGHVGQVASYIPGGSLVQGAGSIAGGVDAIAKTTQRAGLFGLKTLVSTLFGFTKYILGGTWFRASEHKIEHLKLSCFDRMLHPSRFGEQFLLWGDVHHSAALKMITPPRPRPQISPCSEQEFSRFLEHSPTAKRIILERVVSSKVWGLTQDEASACSIVLDRWIENEKALLPQSDEDKKVLMNLFAIFQAISPSTTEIPVSKSEYDAFKAMSQEEQRDLLFLLAFQQNDQNAIPHYIQALQKKDEDYSDQEKTCLLSLLRHYSPALSSVSGECVTPSEFAKIPQHIQFRLLKLVGKECALSPFERTFFIGKVQNAASWQSLPKEERELLSHIALYHFNRLPQNLQQNIYNLSFDEVRRLSRENLACFLWEVLEKIPIPTVAERIGLYFEELIDSKQAQQKEKDLNFVESLFAEGIEKLLDHPKLLKEFIHLANRTIPFEKKILLRDSLDVPLAIYFFSEKDLTSLIENYRVESRDASLPEETRILSLKILKVLKRAYEWHIADLAQTEKDLSLFGLKEGERLPPPTAGLPNTPLDAINRMIGPHIITRGAFYRTFDLTGLALEKALALSGLGIGQIPRGLSSALDSTVGSTALYGGIRTLSIALQICAQFPILMNQLAQALKISVGGKEYSWIEHVERPLSTLPLIPLKLAIPLQRTLLGGMESVRARLDSWNETILTLKKSQEALQKKGTVQSAIHQTEEQISEIFSSSEGLQTATFKYEMRQFQKVQRRFC